MNNILFQSGKTMIANFLSDATDNIEGNLSILQTKGSILRNV